MMIAGTRIRRLTLVACVTFACGTLVACGGLPVGNFKGCASTSVKAGDRVKAHGQDATVVRVIGPSSSCTIDRPIETETRYD